MASKKFSYLDEQQNVIKVKLTYDGTIYTPAVYPTYISQITQDPATGDYFVEPRYLLNLEDFISLWESSWAASLVVYHPEYCFYERCVEDQLSNEYDDNLIEIDKISDFKAYLLGINSSFSSNEFMYPVGTPPSTGVSPYSGNIVDPYFSSGNGVGDLSRIQRAMVHYLGDPSSGDSISIWDAAYRIVHCPNGMPGLVCPSSSMTPGYVFTTDEEWRTFKGMYTSLKQSFQNRENIINSINKTGYNACIGAEVFDPFEYNFYDPNAISISFNVFNFFTYWTTSPFPNWSFWPGISITNISQYYNPEQTCNSVKEQYYIDKTARFATAKMMMPGVLGNISAPCMDEQNNIIPCPESTSDALSDFANIADMNAYSNCNQCPTAVNFENLLKGLATLSTTTNQQDLTNYSNPVQLTCATASSKHINFTNEMAQDLFGSSAPTTNVFWQMDNSASTGTYIKGIFTYAPSTDCTVHIQMPSYVVPVPLPGVPNAPYVPFANPYTYTDVVDFCCIKYNPTAYTFPGTSALSGSGRFSGQVTVKTKVGDPLYSTMKILTEN